MDPDRRTDMVRLPREEEVFEREAVFGRDASSVFPNMQKPADGLDALREMVGGKKFISESELDNIRSQRAGTVEDGMVSADKSLAEILRENKQRKEDEFKEKWRIMKQGGNRPLDAEEAAHFDEVIHRETAREREWAQQQRQELEAFRQAVQEQAATKVAPGPGDAPSVSPAQPATKANPRKALAVVKPSKPPVLAIKVKPAHSAAASSAAVPNNSCESNALVGPASKRQRQDEESGSASKSPDKRAGQAAPAANALSALLGEYSDEDSD